MRTSFKLITFILFGALIFTGCEDDEANGDDHGALVGDWELTALSATYLRTVASPVGLPADTTYSLTASWNYGAAILGANAAAADQTLKVFSAGDTVLLTTRAFDAAGLEAAGIALEMTFLEDDTYTLTGTYPTLRVDMDACSTYLAIPSIQDVGDYTMTYNAAETGGTLLVAPNDLLGDQVLPAFDDGVITFTTTGAMEMVDIDFLDRDAHDTRIGETGESWVETEHRVIMGVPEAPVTAAGSFTTVSDSTSKTAYLQDAQLQPWGYYLTFYALAIQYETTYLATIGTLTDLDGSGAIDVIDGIMYITGNRDTGVSQLTLPYSLLVSAVGVPSDDSGYDIDPTSATTIAAGGKLTYVINSVCIPIIETIDFMSTWMKHED